MLQGSRHIANGGLRDESPHEVSTLIKPTAGFSEKSVGKPNREEEDGSKDCSILDSVHQCCSVLVVTFLLFYKSIYYFHVLDC